MAIQLDPLNIASSLKLGSATKADPLATQQVTEIEIAETKQLSDSVLEETKILLKNTLVQNSPQQLNDLYQSAVDNRVTVYIQMQNGEQEPAQVFVNKVTRSLNYGKAQGDSAESLNNLLDNISKGSEQAYSETRSILAALSKLDSDTESYLAESQTTTRFALTELNALIAEDEEIDPPQANKKSFSLNVKTKEGDEVTIVIKQSNGWDGLTFVDQISVKYEVEGDLSESEHKALANLMDAIGKASDSLLAGSDLTQVMGIKGFDAMQLSGFSLSLKGSGQNIEYSYNKTDKNQYLQGSWTKNGETKANFSLTSEFGGHASEHELAQYLNLLDEANKASYKFNDNDKEKDQSSGLFKNTFTDFMLLASELGSALDQADKVFDNSRALADSLLMEMNSKQSALLGLQDEDNARLKAGFNRLADFSASFTAQAGGRALQGRKEEVKTGYQATLEQKTEQLKELTATGEMFVIKQTQKVSFDSVMSGDLNEREHQLNEQYQIKAVIGDYSMQAMQQSRDVKEHLWEKIYHGMGEYRFQKMDRESLSENSLYLLDKGSLELSKLTGSEQIEKGFMAGDKITSVIESHETYNRDEKLLISREKDYREAEIIALSIESQKRFLDEVLEQL